MQQGKTVQMVVKVPESLRDAFIKTCQELDTTASRELRDFMRAYVKKNGQRKLEF